VRRLFTFTICMVLALAMMQACTWRRQPKPDITQPDQHQPDGITDPDSAELNDFLRQQQEIDSLGRGVEAIDKEPPGLDVGTDELFEKPRNIPDNRIEFDQSIQTSSGQRRASNELVAEGRSSLQGGNEQIALSRFEKAIQIDPKNPYAYYYMAEVRLKQGRYDQAEPLASKAAVYFNSDGFWISRCHLIRSKALLARGETRAAYQALQRSLHFDATNQEALDLERQLKLQLGIQ